MKTTAIGIRLPNHLLDKVKEYGLSNYPKEGGGFDKTATLIALISKGLGLDDVEQPVRQDVLQEIEAIKKRLQNLEAKFVEQNVEQVVLQHKSHDNEPEQPLPESNDESAIDEGKGATEQNLMRESDLLKMKNYELRDILEKLEGDPSAAKKLNKKKLVEGILKAQKLNP